MKRNLSTLVVLSLIVGNLSGASAHGKEISGPQVGDKITSFTVQGALDDERGKDLDLVKEAAGKTLVNIARDVFPRGVTVSVRTHDRGHPSRGNSVRQITQCGHAQNCPLFRPNRNW